MAESDTSRRRSRNTVTNGSAPPGAIQSDGLEPGVDSPRTSARRSAWQDSPRQEPLVNSIGVARTRQRPTPAQEVPPEGARSNPESSSSARPGVQELVVPKRVRDRYVQVGRRLHFEDGDLALHIRQTRTTVHSQNSEVIRDALEIERERAGGSPLRVRGTAEFRAEVWTQAQLMGIEVRGYRPSDLERAKLARTIAQEQRRGRDIASGRAPEEPDREVAPQPATIGQRRVPERERGTPDEGRMYRGVLREHGAAHYRHDPKEAMNYYVKLDTPSGQQLIWGKDFERAIKESLSGVKQGDQVTVQHAGERTVTVPRRRKDEQGNFVREEEVTAYRNRWIVETRDFLRQREEVSRVVRDPNITVEEAIKRHPNLVGTYLELHAAKLAARELYTHEEDRAKFVARVRNQLADEIARGESFSVPRVKSADARDGTTETLRNRKAREPRVQVQEHVRV
jgi:Large polyvalent protein-associated domain 7